MVMNWLLQVADPWPVAKLWGAAALAIVLGAILHRRLYHLGFSKAQEGAERKIRRPLRGPLASLLAVPLAHEARVHPEGSTAVLPRQHPVEPAHPAGRAPHGVHLQHQVAPASYRRAGAIPAGDARSRS